MRRRSDDAPASPWRIGISEIPSIDLEHWFDGTDADRRALAAEVDAHLRRLGLLVVTGHRIDRTVIDDCSAASRAFFHRRESDGTAVAVVPDRDRGRVGELAALAVEG